MFCHATEKTRMYHMYPPLEWHTPAVPLYRTKRYRHCPYTQHRRSLQSKNNNKINKKQKKRKENDNIYIFLSTRLFATVFRKVGNCSATHLLFLIACWHVGIHIRIHIHRCMYCCPLRFIQLAQNYFSPAPLSCTPQHIPHLYMIQNVPFIPEFLMLCHTYRKVTISRGHQSTSSCQGLNQYPRYVQFGPVCGKSYVATWFIRCIETHLDPVCTGDQTLSKINNLLE